MTNSLTTASFLLLGVSFLVVEFCQAEICSQPEVFESLNKTDNVSWYPEPCTTCKCSPSGDTECSAVRCLAPTCPQGTILTLDSRSCCPSCFPSYKHCELNGVTIQHGSSYRSPNCEQCDCRDGTLQCRVLECSEIHCTSRTENECCTNCSASMCHDGGKLYPDKSAWRKGGCILCECDQGTKTCFPQVCPALNCRQTITPDGACCPICAYSQCWSEGKLYEPGQRWVEGPCTTQCVCISGRAQCYNKDCFQNVCTRNTRAVQEAGECCPSCFPDAGMCTEGDKSYYNGQIWNTSRCEYCSCQQGRINCQTAQCSITECKESEDLYHPEGACCPVCRLKELCVHEGSLRTSGSLKPWAVNSCKRCLCKDGEEQCYENNCADGRPEHGSLHSGNKVFSYQELSDGLLYQHDGSAEPDDYALLRASDSENLQNILLPINVQASKTLSMVNSALVRVRFGQQEVITRSHLLYEAGGDNENSLVKYTITTEPQSGSLVMILAQPEGSALQLGWTMLADGTMLKEVTQFSQSDVDQGLIYYQHDSDDQTITTDSFSFKVTDDASRAILTDQLLPITILAAEVFDAPSVSAGSSLGLTAFEGATVIITPAHLSFVDSDTTPENIVCDITEPLPVEQGLIELIAEPQVAVSRFTQRDIDNGLIAYRTPSNLEVGLTQPTYSFKFSVSDDTGKTVPEQQFNILILPVDNKAPSVGSGVRVNVERGSSVLINDASINVTDVDTAVEDLEFFLRSPPQHGDIVKLDATFHTVLRTGASYPYTEFLTDTLYYVHDGSEELEDSFTLEFSDSEQSTRVEIPVTVQYSDTDSPTLSATATMKLRLNEGEKKVITLNELEYEDSSADGLVFYQIAIEPQFGKILYRTQVMELGDGFSQPDITSRHISYQADEELGNLEIMDTVYLNVSDTSGNMAAMQPFTVSIRATDNHPPVVTINADLQVAEGRRKQLTKAHISAEDPDSILTNLMVVVDSVPTLGVLKIITSDGLERGIRQSEVHMFLLSDLYAGIVYYEQNDHENKEPRSDFFWFHMNDGENISPVARFNITILPRNDEPPSIVADTLFVVEGDTTPVTNSSIYVNDIDTEFDGKPAGEHVFTLVKAPREGNFQWENGTEIKLGDSFSMQNVLSGDVYYSHNGREDIAQDTFSVTVSDGHYEDTKPIPIDIALLDDETPRIKINDGLRLKAGGEIVLDSTVLHATDIDSDDEMLVYSITQPVHRGVLYKNSGNGTEEDVVLFTPADLRSGKLMYRNDKDVNQGGFDSFKFDVVDFNENKLMDQVVYIDLLADTTVPNVRVNAPLSVRENSFSPITTSHLYVTDSEANPDQTIIYIDTKPEHGNIVLEDGQQRARPIANFTMADVIANRVFYIHETEEEVLGDAFRFTASDGFNNVTQSFRIRLIQVDDSLPVVTLGRLSATEGEDKLLTEFDIKVTDNDTADELLMISLLAPPAHGSLILTRDGEEVDAQCLAFTMADIRNGVVSYRHDDTETTSDSFTFTVTDQTNEGFLLKRDGILVRTTSPLTMEIPIQLLDDGMPRVLVNRGIPYLETNRHNRNTGKIHEGRLKIGDPDTEDALIIIKVTRIPRNGILSRLPDAAPVSQFTQDDVNNGLIVYTLSEDVLDTEDSFEFSIMDSRPNVVSDLTFHVSWSFVELGSVNITTTEDQSVIEIPVHRTGSLDSYAAVSCEVERESSEAHYSSDLAVLTPQIQFGRGDRIVMCRISIVNDTIYEGTERFTLRLSTPDRVLVKGSSALISISDPEDEPIVQFLKSEHTVNESVGSAHVPVIRSGDLSNSVVVLCTTTSRTAVGSRGNHLQTGDDYISRSDYVVRFEEGESLSNCDIRILDDTLYEVKEQFDVSLSDPSEPARLGRQTTAAVFIAGPNDAVAIQMAHSTIKVYEDERVASVDIIRTGLDLSKPATVWCTTNMLSDASHPASPSTDYVPISRKVSFEPGQSRATCEVTIVDDNHEPIREGVEEFSVVLGVADSSSVITEPSTTIVTIDDSDLDVPMLSFETAKYTVSEDTNTLSVPIMRTGDVSCTVSVICYTRQQTASVMVDYQERTLTNASRVELLAGVRNASCDLELIDDGLYETSEFLLLRLAEPAGCGAITGDLDVALVTILDPEDEPLISLSATSYSIREPVSDSEYASVRVSVSRLGDTSQPAQVRLSTRDRSAISGIDYTATSTLIQYLANERSRSVEIGILYNPEVEWHESFVVVLEELIGAEAGANQTAVINILDTDVAGSLVLPSVPMVVSLTDYAAGKCSLVTEVSPGQPLICLSPCDPLYPHYANTREICSSSNINSTSMTYGWEVSYPVQSNGKVSSYLKVTQATSFSRVDTMLLETFYFRAGFNVRCIATPLQPNGQAGVPIRSSSVNVHSKGLCSNPVIPNAHGSLGAQSFTAKLNYVEPGGEDSNANKIHITVEIPHQDGMLPIISTMPIYNVDYLLTQSSFTKQHVCSNLPNTSSDIIADNTNGFLTSDLYSNENSLSNLRVDQAIKLYQHLNPMTCRWKFEGWFELSNIVNYCGGRVTHNFDVDSASQSFVTVHQPLHVSYIFAKAPMGWASLDHQTTLEFSFYYDTVKFQSGADILKDPEASVEILRVGIGGDGKLSMQLRTRAQFKGLLLTEHYTAAPDQRARLVPPPSVASRFSLKHVWTQPTFDGPVQVWRASSHYSLQDYSGTYELRLLACVASATDSFNTNTEEQKCAVQKVLSFPLKISFQQTNRPVAALYSLSTQFQLTNSRRFFLMDPQTADLDDSSDGFHGVFEKGERLFGRVFWNPDQDLESAFRLQLDKVFICAGRNGYTPSYDPSGKIYNEGPQYGCLEPSTKLKHRFLLLDRGQEEVTTKEFNGLTFRASFADAMPGLADVNNMPGTDGFIMNVDPLFATTSGQRWHVHILYRIGSADSILYGRKRRSLEETRYKVGTNLIMINLNQPAKDSSTPELVGPNDISRKSVETRYVTNGTVVLVLVIVIVLVVLLSVGVIVYVRRRTNSQAHTSTATAKDESSSADSPPTHNDKLPPTYDQVTSISLSDNIGTAV